MSGKEVTEKQKKAALKEGGKKGHDLEGTHRRALIACVGCFATAGAFAVQLRLAYFYAVITRIVIVNIAYLRYFLRVF